MEIMSNAFVSHEYKPATGTQQRRIYVVDDDTDVRKSLHFMFKASNINVWPFASAADFLDQIDILSPAPILLDIRMAEIDGLQLLRMLSERGMAWPVVVLTAHGDITVAVQAMKLGAIEFLEKPFAAEVLDQAVTQAFDILDRTEELLSERDQVRNRMSQLTDRERETLGILMDGVSNKEVAHQLGLSVRTVEMHRANALAKLDVKSIAEVVKLATLGDYGKNSRLL